MIETYAYGITKDLVVVKEEIKRNNIIKRGCYKRKHNSNWPQVLIHPLRILKIEGSRS